MYATIIQCDLHALVSAHARGQAGRTLATVLGALPGFVAFVALDVEEETGAVAVLCIVEDRTSLAEARRLTARWHADAFDAGGTGLVEISAGAVIAQKGL